ncbi:hypothetical protein QBC34DRAFT_310847 [Podospora aff. communis PSN243]|uniref:Uncharacterized protein n=1 Tax=Podospora aff. communis PSN243 TaxID=3040156 RepID=A0AAV9G800_9PEZI|nr:hypothetical protein QBC34DRAFT_310847 [Podospora aff. communis PSN243]
MPSKRKRVAWLPLDGEEKLRRDSVCFSDGGDGEDETDHLQPFSTSPWHRRPVSIRIGFNSIWFHGIFLAANLLLFGLAIYANKASSAGCSPVSHHQGSPVFRHAIRLEERPFNVRSIYRTDGRLNGNKSNVAFSGPPRPELEEAWAEILANQNIHVGEDELGEFRGQKSIVKLSDGSGFYVTVAFQHALHCVQRLHRYLYKDHYHPGLSESDAFALLSHTEHCLDWLRQYVQCNADTTLIPIRWATSVPGPVSKDWGKHQCVAWEPLMHVMASRSFDPFQPGLLIHPNFGNPYQAEHLAQTGAVVLEGGEGLVGGDHGPDV